MTPLDWAIVVVLNGGVALYSLFAFRKRDRLPAVRRALVARRFHPVVDLVEPPLGP
jgi:hypothetical protein